jgi:beta-lactamase superfamily II metal-dependent hydrolase
MRLTIFDVEHGACALLTCDNGMRMMIDCGHNASTGWRPGDHLANQGIKHLDMLIVTNYDEDHVSGLSNLRNNVSIGWLWRNKSVTPSILRSLKSEDGMGAGIEELVTMATTYTGRTPPTPSPVFPNVETEVFCLSYPEFDDENNLSLVLSLRINGISFLFPGDLETKGWLALLERNARFRQVVKDLDVLVASHHGRESGICNDLFDKHGCHPYWVLISDKGYMYDTQKTVSLYAARTKSAKFRGQNRSVLTTRNDGAIHFDFWTGGWGAS